MNLSRLKAVLAGAVALGLAFAAWQVLYAAPRAKLRAELARHQNAVEAYEAALKARPEVRTGLKKLAESTLGSGRDEVVSRFRTGLFSIASTCGLAGISINTFDPEKVDNPMIRARLSDAFTPLRRELRKEPDFQAIRGELVASGSLEQVVKAIAMVREQPWVHRVQSFSIRPEDKDRTRFTLRLGVSTMLLPPDLAPKERGEPLIAALPAGSDGVWAAIVHKNVFREPPPTPVVARKREPAPPPAPAAPPRPAHDDWKLTGVVQSRMGIEAFLVNTRSGQHLSLPTGAAVADARFVEGSGERAVFEIGGEQFEVTNGQTLEQRRPVSR